MKLSELVKKSFVLLFAIVIAESTLAVNKSTTVTANQNTSGYEKELAALNEFLKDFDDGFYGYFEVKDDFITLHFQEGKYSKFKLQDMAAPVVDRKYGQLTWDCKNENYCVTTDWNENGKETGILFSDPGSGSLDDLSELLTNFISAYCQK